jgi:hypothetical protein
VNLKQNFFNEYKDISLESTLKLIQLAASKKDTKFTKQVYDKDSGPGLESTKNPRIY